MESRLFSTLKRLLHYIFKLLLLLPILPDQILRYPNTIVKVALLPNDFVPLWTIYKFAYYRSWFESLLGPARWAFSNFGSRLSWFARILWIFCRQSSPGDSSMLWKRRLYSREQRSSDRRRSYIWLICVTWFWTETSISSTLHLESWSSPLSSS